MIKSIISTVITVLVYKDFTQVAAVYETNSNNGCLTTTSCESTISSQNYLGFNLNGHDICVLKCVCFRDNACSVHVRGFVCV